MKSQNPTTHFGFNTTGFALSGVIGAFAPNARSKEVGISPDCFATALAQISFSTNHLTVKYPRTVIRGEKEKTPL